MRGAVGRGIQQLGLPWQCQAHPHWSGTIDSAGCGTAANVGMWFPVTRALLVFQLPRSSRVPLPAKDGRITRHLAALAMPFCCQWMLHVRRGGAQLVFLRRLLGAYCPSALAMSLEGDNAVYAGR
jgi:hypothetical protein